MPKWITKWIERVEGKFSDCGVVCSFDLAHLGWVLYIHYPKQPPLTSQGWAEEGSWHEWGILLNPSHSPAVSQNRKVFRKDFDYTLRREIDEKKKEWKKEK